VISRVFVSRPTAVSDSQAAILHSWCAALELRGAHLDTLSRDQYVRDPWSFLRDRFEAMDGVAVFGLRHLDVARGTLSPGTREARPAPAALASPWVQIEAAFAIGMNLPTLVLAERGVCEGVFDPSVWTARVIGHWLTAAPAARPLDEFLAAVRARRARLGCLRSSHPDEEFVAQSGRVGAQELIERQPVTAR
jgi:hypothetical protein